MLSLSMKVTISDIYLRYDDSMLISLINDIKENGASSPQTLELLAHIKQARPNEFEACEPVLNSVMGLFYKNKKIDGIFSLFSDYFATNIRSAFGFVATPVQANIIAGINNNKIYSFSGPTSMGKSHAIRHLVREAKKDVAIILPSRALISEYCNILKSRLPFGCIILQFVEQINTALSKKRVYVITPERANPLFQLTPYSIDLFVFDEAQLSEDKKRGYKFDSLVRRASKYFPDAKFVFAHPFVINPEAQITKNLLSSYTHNSFRCTYGTVGKVFAQYDSKTGKFAYFSPYDIRYKKFEIDHDLFEQELSANSGSILIYTSKQKIQSFSFIASLRKYIKLLPIIQDDNAISIINEIKNYIGDTHEKYASSLVKYMRRGIVYHHGSMPLRVRSLVEKFINSGYAKVCVATSTLTQGVNMPFSLVWIEECRFTGEPNDDNIKNLALKNLIGRAGRSSPSSSFDVGIVVLNVGSLATFKRLFSGAVVLTDTSRLDKSAPGDSDFEYVDAVNRNDLNYQYDMPNTVVERFHHFDSYDIVRQLIDILIMKGPKVSVYNFIKLSDHSRKILKSIFVKLFEVHIARPSTPGESAIIKTMVAVALNYLNSASFAFAVGQQVAHYEIRHFLTKALTLPNANLMKTPPLFALDEKFDFDSVVCNTYDFLDKVYRLYFLPLLTAAITEYHTKYNDNYSMALLNYFRYGSTDEKVVWLHKYGYTIEDLQWLYDCVDSVDEKQIHFNYKALSLSNEHKEAILPYCPWIFDIIPTDN